METIEGIAVSPGQASGPAFVYRSQEVTVERQTGRDPAGERIRLERALAASQEELERLQAKTIREIGAEEAAIFEAHAMFLTDPALLAAAESGMEEGQLNAESAWSDAIEHYAQRLEALDDEYMSARATDVRDVGQRVLRRLTGVAESDLSSLVEPSIIVANELTPSDTARLDKSLVLAFCTARGGPTSHAAILARALGKPAVVGAGDPLLEIEDGEHLLVDGGDGTVVRAADEATQQAFEERAQLAAERSERERRQAQEPAHTADGHPVEVVANVGGVEDTEFALENGAEGIGLLRTEFLYLDRKTAPDEGEQAAILQRIFAIMGDRPVVVRTLDVGGDKPLAYIDMPSEENPFLGWRAIRMSLDSPDLFLPQLRALLRAGHRRDLRIMFPMVATLGEARQAREFVVQAQSQLEAEGVDFCRQPQVGIMVEIPSVVHLAAEFAREVDFFSIGTNDLTQYTFAAERANSRVAHLSEAAHPAVLRQIDRVIEAAHGAGIWVGLCGELAGDEELIPVLLGLGLDEFSMSAPFIPRAKAVLRRWTIGAAQQLAAEVLQLEDGQQVRAKVRAEAGKAAT